LNCDYENFYLIIQTGSWLQLRKSKERSLKIFKVFQDVCDSFGKNITFKKKLKFECISRGCGFHVPLRNEEKNQELSFFLIRVQKIMYLGENSNLGTIICPKSSIRKINDYITR